MTADAVQPFVDEITASLDVAGAALDAIPPLPIGLRHVKRQDDALVAAVAIGAALFAL